MISLLVVYLVVISHCLSLECNETTQFDCGKREGTRQCIDLRQKCDGRVDCYNIDEEANCLSCSENGLLCGCLNKSECNARGRCITTEYLCNGHPDCHDGSDEMNCAECRGRALMCVCTKAPSCTIARRCLPVYRFCDGREDCDDGIDEKNCTYCNAGAFMCGCINRRSCVPTGRCINYKQRCDGTKQCKDGQDEYNCQGCSVGAKLCGCVEGDCSQKNECVKESNICDGKLDCQNGGDELNCTSCAKGSTMCGCFNSSQCKPSGKCVRPPQRCNGISDCSDGSDERDCFSCNHDALMCGCLGGPPCNATGKCVNNKKFGDDTKDCPGGEDELCSKLSRRTFRELNDECASPYVCLTKGAKEFLENNFWATFHCDKMMGPCGDRKDKACFTGKWICYSASCPAVYLCENNHFVPKNEFCDGNYGCEVDEISTGVGFKCSGPTGHFGKCVLSQTNLYDNQPQCADKSDLCFVNGSFKCFLCMDKKLVISRSQVCDGITDCFDLSDECFCENQTVCQAVVGNAIERCGPKQMYCNNETACVNLDVALCNKSINCTRNLEYCIDPKFANSGNTKTCTRFGQVGLQAAMCDGRPDCSDYSDECQCKDPPPFCNDRCTRQLSRYGISVCMGFITLGSDACDENARHLCPKRYACRNGNLSSIDVSQLCDGIINCDDGSDETRARCNSTRFYCVTGDTLSVDKSFVEDGTAQCSDGSDECPPVSSKDTIFSNQKEMIANPIFRGLFWVMGFIALVGNFLVFTTTAKQMLTEKVSMPNVKIATRMFILSLSFADFLMSIYLLGIAAKGAILSGRYCYEDAKWRTSSTCSALGVLSILAIQASANSMAIMTAFRLYSIYYPFASRSLKLKWINLACFCAWLAALVVAVIPVFYFESGYFVSEVWYVSNFFKTNEVSKANILILAERIYLYSNNVSLQANPPSWDKILNSVRVSFPSFPIKGQFKYYGTSSVCLPRLFATVHDASWRYSALIISIDLILFLFMFVSYVLMYTRSTAMTKVKSKGMANSSLQKRITFLLFTDFCCWVPICILGFLTIAGVPISKTVYIVSAGILLPINSALNPLIYSNVVNIAFKKLRKMCCPFLAHNVSQGAANKETHNKVFAETKLTNVDAVP